MATLSAAQQNYKENLTRIPWNKETENIWKSYVKLSDDEINKKLPIFNNLVEQEARKVDGAATQRQEARNQVDMSTNFLKGISVSVDERISQINIGGIQNKISVVEEQIAAERGKQSKSNELLEIRKEQSAALEKKYSSNLHSSWLGLWRPLKDNTHTGLNVASFAFGLIALIAIAYLSYNYVSAPGSSGGSAASVVPAIQTAAKNMFNNLSGGFRKVKNSNK
jgi:hypothetical protein